MMDINIRKELDKYEETTKEKARLGECEGDCVNHWGPVKCVRVYSLKDGYDWGFFSYCSEAIETDTNNGMGFI